jgi:hypothetical protein
MKFIEFKKYLNNRKIFLFDSQYRISYHRYNNLKYDQTGGGTQIKVKKIFDYFTDIRLKHFIDSLLNNNIEKTNYIISLYNWRLM